MPKRPIKVLYIDGVGPFGGASRSLFEAIRALPEGAVEPYFVAARGTALEFYRHLARDVVVTRGLTRFDNTQYSHYRGVRWLVALRELSHVPSTYRALRAAHAQWPDIDLVHVNEITEILPGLLAKRLFDVPLVVHVRSPQRRQGSSRRTKWLHDRLRKSVDAVIAIDETTRGTLPDDIPVHVIHNSFTAAPAATPDTAIRRRLDDIDPAALKLGFVGNLHQSKGVLDLIEAAGIVRRSGRNVAFLFVGGATGAGSGLKARALRRLGLQQDVAAQVADHIAAADAGQTVHLLGPTKDIQSVYERLDVICFPSHFDAPGRPIFEAAFFGVPAITCVSSPTPDTLIDGETAITVPARDPERLAAAIIRLADDRSEIRRLGANALALAERNFVPARNSLKLMALYERLLASGPGREAH